MMLRGGAVPWLWRPGCPDQFCPITHRNSTETSETPIPSLSHEGRSSGSFSFLTPQLLRKRGSSHLCTPVTSCTLSSVFCLRQGVMVSSDCPHGTT